jgi:hypothetical protein
MRAERDADRLAGPDPEGYPKMIDVGRDAIDFRGKGNRTSGEVNKIAVKQAEMRARAVPFCASMRHTFTGKPRR